MSYHLTNIKDFGAQFEVMEQNPSYLVLTAAVQGKRKKHWVQVLLNYNGVGELKLPGSFITAVPEITEFTVNQVVEILDISRSTYYRLKEDPTMDKETADKISSLLRLFYYGLEVFEGVKEDFQDWLNTSIPSLAHKKPIDLLKSESGRFAVISALSRIEHNVYG